MALQFVLDLSAFEKLGDDIKPLYKKREDGKYQLEVDGVADKGKLDEFRNTNIELKSQIEKLTGEVEKFKDVDPSKYRQLLDQIQSQEEKKLIKDGNIDEVIKMRTENLIKEYEQKLQAKEKVIAKLTEDAKTATSEKNTYIVEAEMRKAIDNPDLGFQPGVANILKDTVLREFVHKDGKVVRVKPDGSIIYGGKGEPMGLDEFVSSYAKDHPYLVKPSSGGGANNNTNGNTNGHKGKTMPRSEFGKLSPERQNEFVIKEKGVVVDA